MSLAIETLPDRRYLAAGDPDPSFGNGGVVLHNAEVPADQSIHLGDFSPDWIELLDEVVVFLRQRNPRIFCVRIVVPKGIVVDFAQEVCRNRNDLRVRVCLVFVVWRDQEPWKVRTGFQSTLRR